MKPTEEQMWDYIDGFCTEEEQNRISLLIKTDDAYRKKYNDLLLLTNRSRCAGSRRTIHGF